jgi:alpha-glucosidase
MEVPNKTFLWMCDMIMMVILAATEKLIYGTQMARATLSWCQKFVYPKRLFILAISIPAQRYTSWTGDNVASWEHLWIANIQVQRMSISGMGFTGFEIFLEQPSGELYARWMAFFHPFAGLTHLEITAIKNPGL